MHFLLISKETSHASNPQTATVFLQFFFMLEGNSGSGIFDFVRTFDMLYKYITMFYSVLTILSSVRCGWCTPNIFET